MIVLETNHLILRPWIESDAESCFKYAQNPNVSQNAGWIAHKSIEYSRKIILNILNVPDVFAIVKKSSLEAIGSIAIMGEKQSRLPLRNSEAEIGYWVGEPYWGQGLTTEATKEIIRYSFENKQIDKLWCSYLEGNEGSKRVQDKCGFIYIRTEKIVIPQYNELLIEHLSCLTKEMWIQDNSN